MQIERPMITARQFVILAFIGGVAIKGLMLPSILMRISGKDGLFVMAFYFAVEILNLSLLSLLIVKYPEKTFFAMLDDCFGKVGAKIIALLILVAAVMKYTLNLSETKAFFTLDMFASFNWTIMILPLIALCFIIAIKSLRVLGRTAEIFFPFILTGVVLLSLILFKEVPLENVLPLLADGAKPVFDGIREFPIWFGDVLVMTVALGNVKISRRLTLKCTLARAAAAVMIVAFSVALFATYGNIVPLVKYGHNITSLTQYNLGSQEYGRFDLIIYAVWVTGVFVKMAMNGYLSVRCASFVLGVKNYKYVAGALAALSYLISAFAVPTINQVYDLSTSLWAKIPFSLVEYCLIPVLFVVASVRFRRNRQQTAEENEITKKGVKSGESG